MESKYALLIATACLTSFTILVIAKADSSYIEVPEFGFILSLGYLLGKREEKYVNKLISSANVQSVTELISKACDPKNTGTPHSFKGRKRRRKRA